jgi:hypothetical protein
VLLGAFLLVKELFAFHEEGKLIVRSGNSKGVYRMEKKIKFHF